jgi:hypothetical protein
VCDLGIVDLGTELRSLADIEQRVGALMDAGKRPLAGPELRIYRVTR